jgi:hypothetical protein
MTGPEHYQQAQRLARQALDSGYLDEPTRHRYALVAQVHATLALAAATVIQPSGYGCNRPEWTEWAAVASVETAQQQRKSRVRINVDGGAR